MFDKVFQTLILSTLSLSSAIAITVGYVLGVTKIDHQMVSMFFALSSSSNLPAHFRLSSTQVFESRYRDMFIGMAGSLQMTAVLWIVMCWIEIVEKVGERAMDNCLFACCA